jgi:hypothetical protein
VGSRGIRLRIQGLTLQMLYYLSQRSSPFSFGYFGNRVLLCDQATLDLDPLTLSFLSEMTGHRRVPPCPAFSVKMRRVSQAFLPGSMIL